MNLFTIGFVTLVMLFPLPASSQETRKDPPAATTNQPKPLTCESSNAKVIDAPTDGKYRLSHNLLIQVSGPCNELLREALANDQITHPAVLYLNRIRMTKVPLVSVERVGSDASTLQFSLVRNSRDADDRAAWDQLLGPHSAPDFPLLVGVGIAGDPPVRAHAVDKNGKEVTLLFFGVTDKATIDRAFLLSLIFLAVIWLFLVLHPGVLRDPNGRYSLAKSQMAFWGLLVFTAFCSLLFVTRTMEWLPNQILTLLGISAATGVFAIAIDRDEDGRTARRASQQARSPWYKFLSDICSDGVGLSFHRLQAVLWTCIMGIIFAYSVMNRMSMPTFDENLLWLMGISSGTYLGFKFREPPKTAPDA